MGKRNNIHHELEKKIQIEKHLNDIFRKNEIEILDNINHFFSKKIIIDLSNFLKKNIQLVSYGTKIVLDNKNHIKDFSCINLIETSSKNIFFIIFSSNFLSIMINLLFGGNSNAVEIKEVKNITSAELSVNKKIIRFIIDRLFLTYKQFFSQEITCIKTTIFTDLKELNFNYSAVFVKTCFHFSINNTKTFFSLLIPVDTIKELNKKIVHPIDKKKNIKIEKKIPSTISLLDIYDIELNIIVKIINISISQNEFNNLSVGNILLINKPNKIFAFIGTKPIFFASYNRFNETSVIFIEEFVNCDLEFNADKENIIVNSIKKRSDNKKIIDSDIKTIEHDNVAKTIPDQSEKESDNKNILLDTMFHITVELGRSQIKIKDFLSFSKGSMLVLDKLIKEPLDVYVNGHLMASGEIVHLENQYGLRITNIKNLSKNIVHASV